MAVIERHGPGGIELLALEAKELVLGRNPECDVVLDTDPAVSRVHARLERVGPAWTITDLGSANGTLVGGEPIFAPHTLRHGDEILVGRTRLVFRDQGTKPGPDTEKLGKPPKLTNAEKEVLVELCRPIMSGKAFASPASVQEIAARRFTTRGAVTQLLGNLFDKFGIDEGPDRRVRLANAALDRGAITLGDLKAEPDA
ncbi:MAG TPA: FHA domain-containing protein [Acidimicrobiales bacterium]